MAKCGFRVYGGGPEGCRSVKNYSFRLLGGWGGGCLQMAVYRTISTLYEAVIPKNVFVLKERKMHLEYESEVQDILTPEERKSAEFSDHRLPSHFDEETSKF